MWEPNMDMCARYDFPIPHLTTDLTVRWSAAVGRALDEFEIGAITVVLVV